MCDRVIDNYIVSELRYSDKCAPKYTWIDCSSIIRRFYNRLDQSIHTTQELIEKEWNKEKAAILADYVPLKIDIPEPRYFNGLFYEEWDLEDDDDYTYIRPIRLFFQTNGQADFK